MAISVGDNDSPSFCVILNDRGELLDYLTLHFFKNRTPRMNKKLGTSNINAAQKHGNKTNQRFFFGCLNAILNFSLSLSLSLFLCSLRVAIDIGNFRVNKHQAILFLYFQKLSITITEPGGMLPYIFLHNGF